MDKQLSWQFDESPDERPSPREPREPQSGSVRFLIAAVLISAAVLGGWTLFQRQQETRAQDRIDEAQIMVDSIASAAAAGDGERYFVFQDGDSDWFAAQLLPQNIGFYRAGPEVTNTEQNDLILHASTRWQEDGEAYQRVLFFSERGGQLRQVATDPAYWGEAKQRQQLWGWLDYFEADEPTAVRIASFVGSEIDAICESSCIAGRLPVTIQLRSDFLDTAEPEQIAIPSPRLLGLDEAGLPTGRFYDSLRQRLRDYLTPATVAFGIPSDALQTIDYEEAAAAFTAENPHIRIELVPLEAPPTTREQLEGLDAVAGVPAVGLITSGHVKDLTPYANSDPSFDRADFYDQIWQAASWRDRLWFMPQTAQMRLLFYHRDAYEFLGLSEPMIGWTWTEMSDDASSLLAAMTDTGGSVTWGYLDQSFDTLYSFAFNNQTECERVETRPCPLPLGVEDITAGLNWYVQHAGDAQIMPDVSALPAEMRERLLINSLFNTGIWVDDSVFFEHRSLMFPMGVLPFPGSERFEGSPPLWVEGSFISQYSERPLVTWQWLKFLSYWAPRPRYRLIPARPSVGQEVRYWTTLPRALAEPMRASFPLARPVSLADRTLFNWDSIRAVMTGELSTEEAARAARELPWFGE